MKDSSVGLTATQFDTLIALLAQIEATGKHNIKPTLGFSGAEEAFFTIQEFIKQVEKLQEKTK
jgi:hypothetical protein